MLNPYRMTPTVRHLTGSRKHEFYLTPHTTPIFTNSYWDGGSRDYYSGFNYRNQRTFNIKQDSTVKFPDFTNNTYELQPGELVIETSVIAGKPARPTIHCREDEVEAVKTYLGIQ